VTVVTEAFQAAARQQARNLGVPGLPLAVVGHPVAGQSQAVVEARADQALPQVVSVLTGPAEVLAGRFGRADAPAPSGSGAEGPA
jgi:hypothetical protein